jgi:hypothetical protein
MASLITIAALAGTGVLAYAAGRVWAWLGKRAADLPVDRNNPPNRKKTIMTRWTGPAVSGTANGIDFDARYTVAGQSGVAWWLHGWASAETPESWTLDCTDVAADHDHDEVCYLYNEPEKVPDMTRVRAVMVGDDQEFFFDVTDLAVLADDGYCAGCGQTGCHADVRS